MEMKDSGISWIGQIPNSWRILPIRSIFDEVTVKNINGEITTALKFTYGDIVKKDNFKDDDPYVAKTIRNYLIVDKGDIVINGLNLNFDFITQRVGLVNSKGVITSAYMALRPKHCAEVDPEFLTYLLKAYDYKKAFHNMGAGVRKILNFSELKRNYLVIPSKAEQSHIAGFITKQCFKINSLIEKTKQSITKLEEYKKSLITQAVTKGLDPNVEMKDSEIPWIGMIPAKWNIGKLKFYLKRNEPRNPGNKQVLSLYREYGIIPKDSRDDNYNVTSEDTSKYKYVKAGNFVINKMKAWQGSVAVSDYEGIVSPAYYVYKFTNEALNKRYFHYLLRSSYKEEFKRVSAGIRIGQWDLASDDLERTLILIPSLLEQQIIANFLDKKCQIIENLILKKNALIAKLEEYKKSLIFEYITGKKSVGEN